MPPALMTMLSLAPHVATVAALVATPIPLKNGFTKLDLNQDGQLDTVLVAHRENFNAHSFEATTIYIAAGDGLQIAPLESGELVLKTGGGADALLTDFRLLPDAKNKTTKLVTAEREFGDSFADSRPVTFRFYHLAQNLEGLSGLAKYYFKLDRTSKTSASYDDVSTAFREELGLGPDGKPGLRERSSPEP